MADKDNNDDFNDDVEYQFEDSAETADEDYAEVENVTEAAAADDAATATKKSKAFTGKMKFIFMGFAALLLIGVLFIMLGGGEKDIPGDSAQFTAGSAQDMLETKSPFKGGAADVKTAVGNDMLPALEDSAKDAEATTDEEVKTTDTTAINREQLNKEMTPALDGVKQDLRSEFGNAVSALKNQNTQLRSELKSRYDNRLMQSETELAKLLKQNEVLMQKNDSLQTELSTVKSELEALVQQQAITTKNQKRIMYNQGMSFNASGQALTRAGDEEIPQSTVQQKTMKSAIVYNVQAVVPGRAWLMSEAGKSLTVAVGDSLPGLGVVVDIDSLNGVVLTSAGTLLTTH